MASDDFMVEGNGARIPARGFGTFQLRDDACRKAVRAAIETGYRHIDTAAMYGNEKDVGEAIRASGVERDAIWITTKAWTDDIAEENLLRSAEDSLARLGLRDVDLLLIHWPNRAIPLESSIRGLVRAKQEGFARNIGVSNFPTALLSDAVKLAGAHGEVIAVNQCEYHPLLDQRRLIDACRAHGVAFISYSPLGRGDLVAHPTIADIARKLGRKPSQVILRWHLQQKICAIPRSSTPAHIADNFAIGDFALVDADMKAITALGGRGGRMVDPSFAPDWD